ncbi:hypothetical protein FOZ60_003681 [Perkinsus olseni]|uniref:U1-type domain-containing protein n=1 Tax=Perkinsus olseni TaxID=32597 RepID=A0A7J6PHL8_PEROL|nr:hypothetical protein FOZ60_003681 [Perkinsus olseni]
MPLPDLDVDQEGQRNFFVGRNSEGFWECGLCHISVCYEGMLEGHLQGKQHAKNLRNSSWEGSVGTDGETLTSSSVIPPLGSRMVSWEKLILSRSPPAEASFVCSIADGSSLHQLLLKLCDAQLGDWFQWAQHMQGRKHRDNVRASRWSYAQFWQRLTAGKFPYYYEHLTGIWCLDPPMDPFPSDDVFVENLRQNKKIHELSKDRSHEEAMESLGPGRVGSWA